MLPDYMLLKNARILIVDDLASNIEYLAYILREAEFEVFTAINGDAALRQLQKQPIDLILLDIIMPVMDGFEVCIQLKRNPRTRDIPVIFITGRDEPEHIVRGFELGAVDYMVRPIQRAEVIMRIRTHLLLRNLVRQLQQHNLELRQQKEKAEQATKLKDKFVTLVAHDLRGPFQSLLGYLELLRDDKEEPLTAKQQEIIAQIMKSGQRQLSMINEILDIGRLQTGNISVNRRFFDAHYLLAVALDKVRLLAEQKQIQMLNQIPKNTRIYVDEFLFIEVLQNLLTNAIKFSYPQSSIEIINSSTDPLTFQVIDHGTGIAESRLVTLFSLGEKTSTLGTIGEQGTGFGLPYSQEIMIAHQGQITVQSVLGEGSCFSLILPVTRPHVLVVIDQNPALVELIEQYLSPLGIELNFVSNSQTALVYINQALPHLIIADIGTPELYGFSLLTAIKGRRQTQHIPVIIITDEHDDDELRRYCFELGADDYVIKPIVSCDFLPRVRHFIA